MDLEGKTVLILGGSGLVGEAVARKLLPLHPQRIVLVGLYEEETRAASAALEHVAGGVQVESLWGNVFLPSAVAQRPSDEMLADPALRQLVIDDLLGDLTSEVVERSFLSHAIQRYRPAAVVDCINTATAFAYRDVFTSARSLLDAAREGTVTLEMVERHLTTLTMPPLIRHVQIAFEAMRKAGTGAYVKIGTSGTGGMGLNIPYTHSEERPSRPLLTKAAVAGAHSLLLFLVARTPGAPTAIEIKPTSAIAWRKIAYGPVKRSGHPITRFDCPTPLDLECAFSKDASGWIDTGAIVESVYIDVGENGVFARDEFDTVTATGQMEFITPEEVATYVVMELQGRATGKDIVSALDAATAGPTYYAGVLRAAALERLDQLQEKHGVRSVAFEMLGPPRLTKLLYEVYIWSQLRSTVAALASSDRDELSRQAAELIGRDDELRSTIVSIGLPILVSDERLYRGADVLLPPDGSSLDRLVARGWVDLRPSSTNIWIGRARRVLQQVEANEGLATRSGSDVEWYAVHPDDPIQPARFAKWVFQYEEGGQRIKR